MQALQALMQPSRNDDVSSRVRYDWEVFTTTRGLLFAPFCCSFFLIGSIFHPSTKRFVVPNSGGAAIFLFFLVRSGFLHGVRRHMPTLIALVRSYVEHCHKKCQRF